MSDPCPSGSHIGVPANQPYELGRGVIPSGAACAFLGFAQAANSHAIELRAGGDYLGGISNPRRTRDFGPLVMSGSTFEINSSDLDFELQFYDAGPNSRVIVEHHVTTWGPTVYGGTWVLSLEDDTTVDCDFNDVVGFLSWTHEKG